MAKSSSVAESQANSQAERPRLTPADWELAALELIAEKGVNSLAVEPLARRLGITKGSFYWHFPGRDQLLTEALERWERLDEQRLVQSLHSDACPEARLAEFVRRTSRQTLTHRIYLALCSCPDDPRVQPVLKRVTTRRLRFLTDAFASLGLDEVAAAARARLVYASYVGYLQLQIQGLAPDRGAEGFESYIEHVIDTLVRSRQQPVNS